MSHIVRWQLNHTLQPQFCDVPVLVLLWEREAVSHCCLWSKCLPFLTFPHVLGHLGHAMSSSIHNSTPRLSGDTSSLHSPPTKGNRSHVGVSLPSFPPQKLAVAARSAANLSLNILESAGCAKEEGAFSFFPPSAFIDVSFSGALKQVVALSCCIAVQVAVLH